MFLFLLHSDFRFHCISKFRLQFYEYKSRYASEPQVGKAEFVQITDGGTYVPAARLESTRGARSGNSAMQSTNRLSIEIRLTKGTMLRVQGEIDAIHL
ncbi:MAG: hypothetical protein II455_05540, partial [Paludibacteraceae bacterium]|nr:hypothetical protein [Paludibacteraceae bacterium]